MTEGYINAMIWTLWENTKDIMLLSAFFMGDRHSCERSWIHSKDVLKSLELGFYDNDVAFIKIVVLLEQTNSMSVHGHRKHFQSLKKLLCCHICCGASLFDRRNIKIRE